KPGDLSPASQHDPRGRGGSEMRIIGSIAAAASLVALAALGPAGASASTGAELRVVSSSGQLDDLTQYSDTTDMPSSTQADCCFGSTGSGRSVTVQGANALGIVVEAAKSRDDLNPLLLTDAFVDQGLGMGVCGIGGQVARGNAFWEAKVDHKALQVGASTFTIHPGDQVLWYMVPDYTAPPAQELVLNAPVREPAGTPFPVQVVAYDDNGVATPAAGATISGGAGAVTTDASGNALVTPAATGLGTLQATRGGDIPSEQTAVCTAQAISTCPAARGRLIVGSDGADEITGTAGDDQIKPRAGN